MKRADLILVCPAKFGGWMMKNPSVAQIGRTQNGVTEITIKNGACYPVEICTRKPNDALRQLAAILCQESECVIDLAVRMSDLIVPESVFFGIKEDEDNET